MARPEIDEADLHINPIYPRLTAHYKRLLKDIAAQKDIPENVLARQLIVQGLREHIEAIQQSVSKRMQE